MCGFQRSVEAHCVVASRAEEKKGVAAQAAGTIHGDFERGFICAEVMKYDELHELGSEKAVKEAGKYRQEGKNYTVNDADVIFFKCAPSPPAAPS